MPDSTARAEQLAAEHARTAARIAALTGEFDDMVAAAERSNLDDEHDPEGATIGFERAQVIALLHQARSHLAELERAADDLVSGRYGSCRACGAPIDPDRLAALPATRHCVSCAAHPTGRRR